MSRWSRLASYGELVKIHRQIAEAKEAVDLERAQDVRAARENARLTLGSHGLFTASFATGRDPNLQSHVEFHQMVARMQRGGFHHLRKRGELEL